MRKPHHRLVGFAVVLPLGVGLGLAVTGSGCSSARPSTGGSGGSPASAGGTSGGPGGTAATGGTTGSGGTAASGGTTGSGASTGAGGAVGGAGGMATAGGRSGGAGRGGGAGLGGGGGSSTGAGGSTIPSTITLTSPVLMEGGVFPANNTCADPGMGSPQLDWTVGPSGTMSYAVTLTDLTDGRIDWAIWDIPVPSQTPTMITLPAHLDTVAKLTTPAAATQVNSVNGRGYYGPCLGDGTTHTYRFQVYAIPTVSLAGTNLSTDTASANMRAVATATGTLTAMSDAHH